MADIPTILNFNQFVTTFRSISKDQVIRKHLGEASLNNPLSYLWDDLTRKIDIIEKSAKLISNESMANMTQHVAGCVNNLDMLSRINDLDYSQQRNAILEQFQKSFDAIRLHWPIFKDSEELRTFEKKETLEEVQKLIQELTTTRIEGLDKRIEAAEEMQRQAELMRTEAENMKLAAENMKAEAVDMKASAEKTAEGTSIADAQKQFRDALIPTYLKIGLATLIALCGLIMFFYQAYCFLEQAKQLDDFWTWKIAYSAGIRVVILAAIYALSVYFLSLLKAYLNILEIILHKLRIANSSEAFIAAAKTPAHKDLILERLVDSIVIFGESGLLKETSEDKLGLSKLVIPQNSKS